MLVELLHVSPGRINVTTTLAGHTADSPVLLVWHTDDHTVTCHAGDFAGGLLHVGDMLEYLRAEHEVEAAIRELECGYIALDILDSWDGGFYQVKSNHASVTQGEESGVVTVPCADIQS
jgi:hypothetical protein